MDVIFLCCDMFVLSSVRVSFHKVTVRIVMCSSGDHGLVCLQLIPFSAFNMIMVIWLSSLFNGSSSSWVSVRCWAMVNIALNFASKFCVVASFSRNFLLNLTDVGNFDWSCLLKGDRCSITFCFITLV